MVGAFVLNSDHPGDGTSGPHGCAHAGVRRSDPLVIQIVFHMVLREVQVKVNQLRRSLPSMTARGIVLTR